MTCYNVRIKQLAKKHNIERMSVKVSVDYMKKPAIKSSTLNFLKENLLSVTDITRTSKLSEILNKYAGEETAEIYIIQNNKNREAVGVLVDLEHYERLLKTQEAVEQANDDYIYQVALHRKNELATIPISDVINEDNFNLDELIEDLPNIELDED